MGIESLVSKTYDLIFDFLYHYLENIAQYLLIIASETSDEAQATLAERLTVMSFIDSHYW